MICHYWYFKDSGYKFESYICNGCHDLLENAMNFNDVPIVSIKGTVYRIHFWYMSEDDAINIIINSYLNENSGLLQIFFITYKNETATYLTEKQS